MKTLYEYITRSAEAAVMLQNEDGSFLPGHNGPYFDIETPVRRTSHWLITFLKVYDITKDKKYLNAAEKAVNYLLSKEARPEKAAFWHRMRPGKDFSNGLIGQAWSIEALTVAARYFDNREIVVTAENVFLMHAFNERLGLWKILEVDGSVLSIDETFNHQLWFAAAGGLLLKRSSRVEIGRRVGIFMDNLPYNLALYRSGLIVHQLKPRANIQKVKTLLQNVRDVFKSRVVDKAIGYHQFNLYAFALLKQCCPKHFFWRSNKFQSLWSYACTDQYQKRLEKSQYSYPYNPPGFEMAFALEVFEAEMPDKRSRQKTWVANQVRRCFDFESGLMSKESLDPETSSARMYEATRLPDLNI